MHSRRLWLLSLAFAFSTDFVGLAFPASAFLVRRALPANTFVLMVGCSDSAGIFEGGLSPANRCPRSAFGVMGGFANDC